MYKQQELIDKIKEELERERATLYQWQSMLQKLPEGNIRICRSRGHTYYYQVESVSSNGKSVRKNEHGSITRRAWISQKTIKNQKLIEKLLQRRYLTRAIKKVERNIKILNGMLHRYEIIDYPNVRFYGSIDIEKWDASSYSGNPFHAEQKVVPTKEGTFVRSKSEAAIYDELLTAGVYFRYEAAFNLPTGKIVYPDFTIIREDGNPFLWEHLGMIFKPENVAAYLKRLVTLGKAGFKLADNLIITWDSPERPFSAEDARRSIKLFLQINDQCNS